MHLPKLTSAVALTALTFTLSAPPAASQTTPKQVSFICRSITPRTDGLRKVPATVAFIPGSRRYQPIIAWESDSFPNTVWTPQKRCEEISQRFQDFYNQDRLRYMTVGQIKGLGVICAAQSPETCNSRNQLFTVKPGSDPQTVLEQLIELASGRTTEGVSQTTNSRMWETVNNQKYLNFGVYLESAPVEDVTE
ncbi:COP23 domain-containing protein [Anabaenopsis sp. FSS-46]|uniref:COP23 domain-containing protein n=1 Tax=Anabaenopsis sp. FSS-46 TaxID=2971766 RepID=UPI0024768445|nr:COP23 domain-containing protein [Anabaenopsis sp. FSS-46]MDH6099194.1 COP23 domain-containing protein [Anabaenopsis sp. FSS-46]